MLASSTTFFGHIGGSTRVDVHVDIRNGLPAFSMVGVDERDVRESRERIRAAILNEGFEFPQRRITVSLNFVGLRPPSYGLDLPIAAAILRASSQISIEPSRYPMLGELSLDGGVRPVHGTLPSAEGARDAGFECFVVPWANHGEASLSGLAIAPIKRLGDLSAPDFPTIEQFELPPSRASEIRGPDLKDLRGHELSQRALEIAAAGGHHILFNGAPGCGKTMLARRLPSVLPSLTHDEALEVTRIQSITGLLRGDGLVAARPFRAPHHSVSASGLTGGGSTPMPGEVTLANNGVLFLDELAEFSSRTLESLREPLEFGEISVTRGQHTYVYPARFMLVAATNPCPCGAGDRRCRCSIADVARYARRLSGPLFDRFDIHCRVVRPTPADVEAGPVTDSATVRARVEQARERQKLRFKGVVAHCNGQLDGAQTRQLLDPPGAVKAQLRDAYRNGSLSLRGYDRTLRIARTIADLDCRDQINEADMAEALSLRALDTEGAS